MAQDLQLAWDLYYNYENYKEKSLTNRRFKHSDIKPLIEQLKNKHIFQIDKVGESSQGRELFLLKTGMGKTKVFLWSQMHGDEPTATAALFDIFNFFADTSNFVEFKEYLQSKLTIYFLPMVNPDGAEIFQRRNIFEIDLNRDAIRLQTPEANILKEVFDSLRADFGFNLHDQNREYAVGYSFKSAAISFLAPAPDYERTTPKVREDAIKLIGNLYEMLNNFIPGHIAKYSDEYEPRAFGDNFTKWGTSTVLVESGGWKNDREKHFLRKINYIILLSVFKSIADESYRSKSTDIYNSIPSNEKLMMDFILRNLKMKINETEVIVDIGINYDEVNTEGATKFYYKARIEDIGDLSVFTGYNEIDLSGHELVIGQTHPLKFNSLPDIGIENIPEFYRHNYTNVIVKSNTEAEQYSKLPLNIILSEELIPLNQIKVEAVPNFLIKKDNIVMYAVINGFLLDAQKPLFKEGNSLIIK